MKSWADHCSSDEESDDGRAHHPANLPDSPHKAFRPQEPDCGSDCDDRDSHVSGGNSVGDDHDGGQIVRRQYDIPPYPPYTAHVGNLSYDIREDGQLAQEVEALVERRYGG
eukprot:CAMPEP_0183295398 /NCGR_PEP_ID=MMETSP0160_2-20130417/3372_1 /TAXON_ID=2839 ORGANISM="Odontella Sinensis, Strain Grunow 1884" /NCGR_SAMPLE_ID=MMETSP0160_2 /ASSEMBLY_ACC=CAM_ASM_000250 /LENGTH=110 /DNA_ID=CAMNT_0025456877 /DNA_START=426 /DNA_END=755 /DNA_ORIENTATION=-